MRDHLHAALPPGVPRERRCQVFRGSTLGPLGVAALLAGMSVGGVVLAAVGRLLDVPPSASGPCGAALVLGAAVVLDRRHYRRIPFVYSRWSDPDHVEHLCHELRSEGLDVTFEAGAHDEGPAIRMRRGDRHAVLRALDGR